MYSEARHQAVSNAFFLMYERSTKILHSSNLPDNYCVNALILHYASWIAHTFNKSQRVRLEHILIFIPYTLEKIYIIHITLVNVPKNARPVIHIWKYVLCSKFKYRMVEHNVLEEKIKVLVCKLWWKRLVKVRSIFAIPYYLSYIAMLV